jgi:ABC-type Mn2+/Zn2+ transport system ATPase subunit
MSSNEVVIRFEKVSFLYGHNKTILDEVDFSVRRGMKVTVMGQNGAGKSTIFNLINNTATTRGRIYPPRSKDNDRSFETNNPAKRARPNGQRILSKLFLQ